MFQQKVEMLALDATPNDAHRKLAQLEKAGKPRAVVTQNIDGLHQYFRGEKLVVINKSPTPVDKNANILIQEPIGKVFAEIAD